MLLLLLMMLSLDSVESMARIHIQGHRLESAPRDGISHRYSRRSLGHLLSGNSRPTPRCCYVMAAASSLEQLPRAEPSHLLHDVSVARLLMALGPSERERPRCLRNLKRRRRQQQPGEGAVLKEPALAEIGGSQQVPLGAAEGHLSARLARWRSSSGEGAPGRGLESSLAAAIAAISLRRPTSVWLGCLLPSRWSGRYVLAWWHLSCRLNGAINWLARARPRPRPRRAATWSAKPVG